MRHITPEAEEERMNLYKQGLKDAEIGDIQGVCGYAIHIWRVKHNLPKNKGSSLNIQEKYRIRLELYNKGLNDQEIADSIGMKSTGVSSWRNQHKLPAIRKHRYDKLSDEKIIDICRLHDSGHKRSYISHQLNISEESIINVLFQRNVINSLEDTESIINTFNPEF